MDNVNKMLEVTAGIIIIGNEILSGRTQDSNLVYISKHLDLLGIRVAEARIIPDDESAIISHLNYFRTAFNYVFTTGGIGPTHDDITSIAVAKAFSVKLVEDKTALWLIDQASKGRGINKAHRKMAQIPTGASLIDNRFSGAPGFQIENVFVMAGVPKIMQLMFAGITDRLTGGEPIKTINITTNIGESVFADLLADLQRQYPEISIGSYPYFHDLKPGVNLVIRATDQSRLQELGGEMIKMINRLGGEILEIQPVAE